MTRTITDLLALREGLETGKYYADGTVVNLAFSEDDHMVVATTADEGFALVIAALPELFDAMERMRDALQIIKHEASEMPRNTNRLTRIADIARAALANRSEGDE